jgi:molecular chaperone DnaK (HSP70)
MKWIKASERRPENWDRKKVRTIATKVPILDVVRLISEQGYEYIIPVIEWCDETESSPSLEEENERLKASYEALTSQFEFLADKLIKKEAENEELIKELAEERSKAKQTIEYIAGLIAGLIKRPQNNLPKKNKSMNLAAVIKEMEEMIEGINPDYWIEECRHRYIPLLKSIAEKEDD